MSKELFEKWLEDNTSLSERTKKNYLYAISQISSWMSNELAISENLYELSNVDKVDEIVNTLEQSKGFNERNQSGNRIWSSAIKFFKEFTHNKKYENSVIARIKETCEKLLAEKKLLPLNQLNEGYKLFLNKFGTDKLKSIDGEALIDLIFNIGNRDGLTYWLEFKNDEEFKTSNFSYGSISGGSAFKYVMFKRNSDGKWVTGNPQNPTILSIEEAIGLGRKLRDSLVAGSELIEKLPQNASVEEYIQLQSNLNEVLINNMHSLGWVHKYYHMLYPEKIDGYHTTKWQKHALVSSNIKPVEDDKLYIMSGQLMEIVRQTELPASYVMNSMCDLFGSPVNYYRIGTGDNGNSYWEDMKSNLYVAIGWDKLNDLNEYADSKNMKKIIMDKLVELYNYDSKTASRKAGEIIRFYNGIEIGDIVVAVLGEKVLGIGQITGNYEYIKERPYPHSKNVEWIKTFKEPIQLPKPSSGKLTSCYPYKDLENIIEIERVMKEDETEFEEKPVASLPPLIGIVAEIDGVISRKKQVILYGPPGTGKTYHAEKACCELASRHVFKKSFHSLSQSEKEKIIGRGKVLGFVRTCCFHPTYGYEDFIEGIKPKLMNGQTAFELNYGIFKNICKDAEKDPQKKYYLIIDEINRGDISRIFGELIMLIEANKRGKEILLPLSNEPFCVPDNVYIIGTMNTADRSIALLDVALRRRFGFIELMPEYSLLKDVSFDGLPLSIWLKALNERICEHLGRDARNLQIGHAYFLEKEKAIIDSEKFKKVIKEDIIPLIEEYCYGDYSLIAKILGDGLVDAKYQTIRFDLFNSSDVSNLITALLSPCPTIRLDVSGEDSDDIENDIDSDEINESDGEGQ